MKPKLTCRSCSAELTWGVQKCESCGTEVEWPAAEKRRAGSEPAEKKAASGSLPVRNIAAVVIVIGLGVVLMEYFTGTGSVPESVQQQQQQAGGGAINETGADMSALPHIEELEGQLKTDPSNQNIRRELGNHLMDARFYHRAIAVYKEFLERDAKDADIRVDMGICYKELGDLETAEKEMTSALKDAPKHLYAHFNLGIVNLVQGDLAEATEWFKKTAKIDPQGQLGQRAQQLIDQHLSVNVQ